MFKGPPLFRLAVYIQISINGLTLIERVIKLSTILLFNGFHGQSVLNTSFETVLAKEIAFTKEIITRQMCQNEQLYIDTRSLGAPPEPNF